MRKIYVMCNFGKDGMKVVWLNYTLRNVKCMIANLPTQDYFECTYNSEKNEIYIDRYKKIDNIKLTEEELNG
jgi:hypothetical protein